jgi:hypothetical protein
MRAVDWLARRFGNTYWEGQASGAAVWTQSYGSPNREAVFAQFADWARKAYGGNAIVFAAEAIRMALLSEAVFQWQAKNDLHLFGDTSLRILEAPWPGGSSGALIARMEQDQLYGNAYIWRPPGEDRLVRLRPDWTSIVSELVNVPGGGEYREVRGYWVQDPSKAALNPQDGEFYPAAEVAHWAPIPDPAAEFRGMSWLTAVVRDVAGDDGLGQFKIRYLENNASPNLLIKYPMVMTPAAIDSVRERITARYGGVDNAFKTMVIDRGADATIIGNSLQQMSFADVTAVGSERILAASGVPGVLVGLEPLRGAGRGYQESMQRFANLWARPQWSSLCSALEQVCAPPGDGARLWFDTANIAALQDGTLERGQAALVNMQALLTATQAGATLDSAVAAITAADMTLLKAAPMAAPLPAGNVQHMLPQAGQPGVTATPLPPMNNGLPVGPTSPGTSDNKRPAPSPTTNVRRALPAGVNGHRG